MPVFWEYSNVCRKQKCGLRNPKRGNQSCMAQKNYTRLFETKDTTHDAWFPRIFKILSEKKCGLTKWKHLPPLHSGVPVIQIGEALGVKGEQVDQATLGRVAWSTKSLEALLLSRQLDHHQWAQGKGMFCMKQWSSGSCGRERVWVWQFCFHLPK